MTETALSGSGASSASAPSPSFLRDPSVPLLVVTVVAAAALMPVEPSRAFGLPAHALLLHVPVVLIPILAAAVIVFAVRPAWRRRYGLATGVLALVTMAATILTAGAGEALRDERAARFRARAGAATAGTPRRAPGGGGGGRLEHHADLGQQLRLIVILLAVVFVALVVIDRYGARATSGPAAGSALSTTVAVVAAVIAVFAAIWVVRTGHVGAEMTWHEGAMSPVGHLLRSGRAT